MKKTLYLFGLTTALLILPVALPMLAQADDERPAGQLELLQAGRLRVAVYNEFAPYSHNGKGVDVDIAKALGKKLGLEVEIAGFQAGEDMNDDLRNMVWKGHYLGTRPGDLMMHVPVDYHLSQANPQVQVIGPYGMESIAVARNPQKVAAINGSAAVALEVFTREKIGVEIETLADSFLLGSLNGRLRENVVHFHSIKAAVDALKAGQVAAVMAPRGELEAAMGAGADNQNLVLDSVRMPELKTNNWAVGLAVKTDNATLNKSLSNALAELIRDGSVAAIYRNNGITYQTITE